MVSIGSMNTQINIRIPEKLLFAAKEYSREHGFGSIQEFIKEIMREKLFDEPEISKEELDAVRELASVCESKGLYGNEKDLFKKLRRRK